jgi:hypothetical protein
MQLAERVYALTQQQNDATLTIGAYRALACTHYYLGNFESGRQYAMRAVQIWGSGCVQSYAEEHHTPVVNCLFYGAMCEWHLGEIGCYQAMMEEGISLAKELNDMNSLALALQFAAIIARYNPAEVDRLASELIELSTRHDFSYWLTVGTVPRLGAQRFGRHSRRHSVDRTRYKRLSGKRYGLRSAILACSQGRSVAPR